MPVTANADNNVPWIGPRARYSLIGSQPVWVYQRMNKTGGFTGVAPTTLTKTADELDPSSSAGLVEWTGLETGGLFTALYHARKPFILEAVDLKTDVTLSIVRAGALTTATRTFPTTFPAKIAAGEIIRATGGDTTAYAGLLIRAVEEKVW